VRNVDCYEDENPSSPLVLKSLRGDMKQEQGATSTALDQDMDAMGGDTDGERTDKELTSTILTTPQTLNSTERETVNQLAIKARDSLEKKKRVQKPLQRRIRNLAPLQGARQGNLCVVVCTPLYFHMIIGCWNVRGLNDPIKHSTLRKAFNIALAHPSREDSSFLVWLKLELETRIKIMFLNFFCIIGPSCIIMISLVMVVFGFVGMLIR
jgi:hypothetical protein